MGAVNRAPVRSGLRCSRGGRSRIRRSDRQPHGNNYVHNSNKRRRPLPPSLLSVHAPGDAPGVVGVLPAFLRCSPRSGISVPCSTRNGIARTPSSPSFDADDTVTAACLPSGLKAWQLTNRGTPFVAVTTGRPRPSAASTSIPHLLGTAIAAEPPMSRRGEVLAETKKEIEASLRHHGREIDGNGTFGRDLSQTTIAVSTSIITKVEPTATSGVCSRRSERTMGHFLRDPRMVKYRPEAPDGRFPRVAPPAQLAGTWGEIRRPN